MPSKYLVQIALEVLKKGTGGKDVNTELKGVDTTVKKLQAGWKQFAAAGAAVAGALYTVKKAFDFGKEGAIISQTTASFDGLIEKLGAAPDTLDKLRTAARGTVDDMTLMSSTSTLLAGTQGELASALAASTPELMNIAKAANKLNPTLGDTTFLYNSLALGIKRASPMILDNLGLTIKIGEANEKYAASMGKTVEQLTAEEQKIALLKATLEAGNVMMEQAGGTTEAMGDSFAQLETELKNIVDQFKTQLTPVILGLVPTIQQVVGAFGDFLSGPIADFLTYVGGRMPEALVDTTAASRDAGASFETLAVLARQAKTEMLWGDDAKLFWIDVADHVKLTGEELITLGEASGATESQIQALAEKIGVDLDVSDWMDYADTLTDTTKAIEIRRFALENDIETQKRQLAMANEATDAMEVLKMAFVDVSDATVEAAEAKLRDYEASLVEKQAHESMSAAMDSYQAALQETKVDVEDLDGSVLRYAYTSEGLIVVLDKEKSLTDAVAEAEAQAKQRTDDLAKAQEALARAVDLVRDRYEGFYGTLAEGVIALRDLGAVQQESAADYEKALSELEAKQRNVTANMEMNWKAALPDKSSVAERLQSAGDVWDEWALRLQDIINLGVESPWYAALQDMGMEKPPDIGVKEWAEDLKAAFYAGEIPDLLPPEWAANVRAQQQEATAAFNQEAAKRKAAVQEEIDALNAAREAQLEAEREQRAQATVELALSLAEQTGALQDWSAQEFGPDFSQIADSASEVMGLLESGMLTVDGSLEGLIQNMVTGIGTMLDTTGAAAAEWPEQMKALAEFDPLEGMAEKAEAQAATMAEAITKGIPLEAMKPQLEEVANMAMEVGPVIQSAVAPEEMPEDPLGLNTMFTGFENIMNVAPEVQDAVVDAFQGMQDGGVNSAQAVGDAWVGRSALPDITTGAVQMQAAAIAAFQSMQQVGVASGQSVGTSWATGLQAAQQELKKMVASLKSLPKEIEIHLTTVVTGGGPEMQHGGQWTVRGPVGVDNVPVQFMATAGEVVTVTPRGQASPRGFQHGGQFTVPGMARQVTMQGDTHNWYIQDQGSVALAMRLVENKRRERLNDFMGV